MKKMNRVYRDMLIPFVFAVLAYIAAMVLAISKKFPKNTDA